MIFIIFIILYFIPEKYKIQITKIYLKIYIHINAEEEERTWQSLIPYAWINPKKTDKFSVTFE